ncbi:ATP-binding protein [Acidovorax sp. 106]|uniref:ATP-binding protein n=1 Tax=Acidovorax sp. 106 TaxID=2135637 RepID=UPI000EB16B26|nr:ATP-binding protein [Acidovorax sp. 106]RLJ37683.1 two-component system osmolarity sensor histidine kinase EnvZ [Acidovorax sp. 106]
MTAAASAVTAAAAAAPRGLWPRSLLGRNLLLMAVLIVLGQLCAAALVRHMILKPRVAQVADGVARNVAAIRAGLQALPPGQRQDFVQAFNAQAAQTQAHALAAAPGSWRTVLSPMERQFVRAVTQRLDAAQGTQATSAEPVWRRDSSGVLSLRVVHEGAQGPETYWLNLPSVFPTREFTGAWLMATLASMVLALAGAWWLQRHLNQPLQRVVQAAQRLARGQPPAPLSQDGPTEIATVARSFNHMAHSLAQADRERALMLAGVSHDLRTPLTKLRLGVEIAGAQIEPELATGMVRSMDEMDAIVGQFLHFARMQEAEPPQPAALDDLAQAIAQAQADHGRSVALELGAPPLAPVQPQALRRAVDNLVENAWRHGTAPVVLRTGSEGDAVWIEVQDHGPGLPASELDRVRQPFARGEAARSGRPGAGLGLAIADRVARAHGGRLTLHSAPGQGLRARLVLPVGLAPKI